MRRILITAATAASLAACAVSRADDSPRVDTPAPDPTAEQRGAITESKEKPIVRFPLKVGMDAVTGFSNVPGFRRYSDGMWAGSGPAYPSVGYLAWDGGNGHAAKASIGMGSMSTSGSATFKQPVEAWWQVPAGKASLTMGKFWVPFAAQEWQYETKPGLMLGWEEGPHGLSFSANYNEQTRAMNGYFRAGRSFGQDASIGFSYGFGRGLSYGSVHDRAWGVDASFAAHGFRFTGEYVGLTRRASETFGSTFGKLEYENLGSWRPFVAFYSWNDRSGTFGRFRSTVYGTAFQLTPMIAIEAAYAPTSNKKINWLQLRWAWER
jgi:hypothetical protein